MASLAEQIATAAKSRLDAISGALSAPFSSVLDMDGRSTPSTIGAQAVVIVSPLGPQAWERAGRGTSKAKVIGVVVAIKQRCTAEADLSGYLELAEEILDDLSAQALAGFTWQSLDAGEPFDFDTFQQTGVASLTAGLEFKGITS